jgi:CBS domain-containing protein
MMTAADVMTRFVVTADPDATVAEVAKLLTRHAISAVPICDAAGGVVGILSEGDLLRPFTQTNEDRRTWWLDVLSEGDGLAPEFLEYVRLDRRRARDLMQTRLITAAEETPIAAIAELLIRHQIKRVPIVRDGKLVGIVTRADLVRAIVRSPEAFAPASTPVA